MSRDTDRMDTDRRIYLIDNARLALIGVYLVPGAGKIPAKHALIIRRCAASLPPKHDTTDDRKRQTTGGNGFYPRMFA